MGVFRDLSSICEESKTGFPGCTEKRSIPQPSAVPGHGREIRGRIPGPLPRDRGGSFLESQIDRGAVIGYHHPIAGIHAAEVRRRGALGRDRARTGMDAAGNDFHPERDMGKAVLQLLAVLSLVWMPAGIPSAGSEELLVQGYYGEYDATRKVSGFPSRSLKGPVTEPWTAPEPGRAWRIGVLFPHLKDPYWETADYGIVSYARKRNLKITLYTAGAYANFGNQRMQLMNLVARKQVDGILLASVDYTRMDPFVEEACSAGVPVVALINDIYAPAIQAKVMVSFFEMGTLAGRYILEHAGKRDLKIAVLPGPRNAGWAADSVAGETIVSDEEIDRMIEADMVAAKKKELDELDSLTTEIDRELGKEEV